MIERPHSRYTRAKTWSAIFSQYINAGYALVPHSSTNNSIDVVYCKTAKPSETQNSVKAAMRDLWAKEEAIKKHYGDQAGYIIVDGKKHRQIKKPYGAAVTAIVLAKSSDYHHYHLSDYKDVKLVICGQHDSYLQIPVWEVSTNKRYAPMVTVIAINDIKLGKGLVLDHNILIGALVCGDRAAIAYRDDKSKMSRWTRNRIIQEVTRIQEKRYQGRPLAFLSEAEREEIGSKISNKLIEYHARRKAQ